jgi:hypothetical protein
VNVGSDGLQVSMLLPLQGWVVVIVNDAGGLERCRTEGPPGFATEPTGAAPARDVTPPRQVEHSGNDDELDEIVEQPGDQQCRHGDDPGERRPRMARKYISITIQWNSLILVGPQVLVTVR